VFDAARLFVTVGWYSYKALFIWLTPIGYVMSKVAVPLLQITVFALLARSLGLEPGQRVIGNAVQSAALNGVFGTMMALHGERNFHTLAFLIASPANRLVTFGGRILAHVVDGMIVVLLGLTFGVIVFGLDLSHANRVGTPLAFAVTVTAISGLGLLLGSAALVTRDILLLGNVAYWTLVALCGVNLPVDQLPEPLRMVAQVLPLTRGLQAVRLLLAGGSLAQAAPLLAGELLVGAAYYAAAYVAFQAIERVAARRATLELD